jgi:hypothetical protein
LQTQIISVPLGVNFSLSETIPDFYTADYSDLPIFGVLPKIKIAENV